VRGKKGQERGKEERTRSLILAERARRRGRALFSHSAGGSEEISGGKGKDTRSWLPRRTSSQWREDWKKIEEKKGKRFLLLNDAPRIERNGQGEKNGKKKRKEKPDPPSHDGSLQQTLRPGRKKRKNKEKGGGRRFSGRLIAHFVVGEKTAPGKKRVNQRREKKKKGAAAADRTLSVLPSRRIGSDGKKKKKKKKKGKGKKGGNLRNPHRTLIPLSGERTSGPRPEGRKGKKKLRSMCGGGSNRSNSLLELREGKKKH